ncbi:hypothetical protein H1R20_g5444, partial [Candolleomyces eurysporus]
MRYAVLVTGPAGAGKSTFSTAFMTHIRASKRTANLVNLDPAASPESFEYEPVIDIKDLVSLEDVMTDLEYGPNGGLVYCFEYRLGIRVCATYLIESQFMEDKYKFFSGVLSAMSAMVNLEIPWINIMSKMDLVLPQADSGDARNGARKRRDIARYLDPDPLLMATRRGEEASGSNPRFHALNQAIVQLIEDHPLVSFLPLNLQDTDSIENVVSHIDYTMQYGEDEEPKEPHDLDEGDFQDM